MAVTTRDYNITEATPVSILNAMSDAFVDLGWNETESFGYLATFTNTPGSIVKSEKNKRYLIAPTSTTGSGTGAVFDVLRTPYGAISTVTLVTGGKDYMIQGRTGVSTSGTTMTVGDTTGMAAGQVVTKLAGTGTLQTNTVIVSVDSATQITINQAPSVALSAAYVTFADTITLGASAIGGSSYTVSATATNGSTTLTVANNANLFVGQVVSGTNICALTTITAISGLSVTISKATLGAVSGNLTFSDDIICTVTGVANATNLSGTASGLTITNVATSANLYVGAKITLLSGTPQFYSDTAEDSRVFISSISGTGPYTITLRNATNTFKGFDSSGAITFKASKGDTSCWFAYDIYTAPQTYAWGVVKVKNSDDLLGTTFWHIYVGPGGTYGNALAVYVKPMPGFSPVNSSSQGVANYDYIAAAATLTAGNTLGITVASSWYVPLTLKTRQSGVDTNFSTWAFFEGNNNRSVFYFSKYNNSLQPWSLNDVFLGGCYEIYANTGYATYDAGLLFRTRMNYAPKRMAEFGYSNYNNVALSATATATYYRSNTGNRMLATPTASYGDISLYSRQTGDLQTSLTTQIPVYKNLPICPFYMPCPYYIPEDFGLVEIPWQNPAIKDTVTISPTEVYTIVQLATNQITYTGLAFVARTT